MRYFLKIDPWLILPVFLLVIMSLTTLLSINIVFFKSQLLSLAIALIGFFLFSRINMEFFRKLKLPIYIVSLILLGIILLIGIKSRGAIRWIDILGVRLQFSEILKPFLAIAFASFLADHNLPRIKFFVLAIVLLFPILILIYLQPDLGNALIFAAVGLVILIVDGLPLLWFFLLCLPVFFAVPFLWNHLHEYQRQRFLMFLHPTSDPLGASYNGIQAIITVGAGALFGRGLSEGTQSALHFLPERQTDFIFATLAEGLGFIGASIVILAFIFLCIRIYILYRSTDDTFSKLITAASFAFLLIQFFVNVGMNMGFLPIVGVTLPFVSYGGSSLLSNFIFLGILSSVSASRKHKPILEIR